MVGHTACTTRRPLAVSTCADYYTCICLPIICQPVDYPCVVGGEVMVRNTAALPRPEQHNLYLYTTLEQVRSCGLCALYNM